jgi:hypothetical protein
LVVGLGAVLPDGAGAGDPLVAGEPEADGDGDAVGVGGGGT